MDKSPNLYLSDDQYIVTMIYFHYFRLLVLVPLSFVLLLFIRQNQIFFSQSTDDIRINFWYHVFK